MGIVKVASGVPTSKSGYSCGDEDLTQEERMLLQSFPSPESDDCERAEVNCELAMSGGQKCNVPYGLYDLPELKDILSLETWNSCLTEADRFRLAAYLPDMDQHDFFATMKELFSDSPMFFGSPLRSFFHRLNGGFYSPEVSQARELLMIFQRRRYYHFLKSYHDGMIWKFASMDKLWRSCNMSTRHEEKVHIWHKRQYEKPLTFVDLNSSPFNGSLSIICEGEAATFSPLKRAKLMNGTVTTHISAKHKEIVHRANSMEMSSSKGHIFHLPYESGEKWIKLPKGVLKIRTNCASLTDDKAGIHHTPGLIPLNQLGMQVSTFSPYASAQAVHDFAMTSSYSYNINASRNTLGDSRSSPCQWEGALETYPLLVKSPSGVQNTVLEELKRGNPSAMPRGFYQSAAKHSAAYSNEAYDTREFPHEKNLLKNFGRQNAVIPDSSPDPYVRTTGDHQTNRYMKMHNPKNAENISEMLALGTSTNPPYNNFSEQSDTMGKYHDELKMNEPPANKSVTKVEGHRFPYTYTRRKLQKRLDLVGPDTKSTMVDSESPNVLDSMANVKAKAIKL